MMRTTQFGKWEVNPGTGWIRLSGQKERKHVRPKLMDVLMLLVQAEGKVVSRRELLKQGWPETMASDESLTRCIADLRKLLGDDGTNTNLIETVPKRGYRIRRSLVSENPLRIHDFSANEKNEKSAIVVLPFSSEDSSQQLEVLAEGISEEALSLLSRVSDLRVISKSSALRFKGDHDYSKITRLLNVDFILNGSVSGSKIDIRLDLNLIDTRSQEEIWTGSINCLAKEISALPEKVALTIIEQLDISNTQDFPPTKTVNPQVYMLMLQARHLANLVTPEGWRQSNEYFKNVLEIDPEHADAWAGMAKNYALEACDAQKTFAEGLTLARASVNRALEIDPHSSMALSMDGWLQLYDSFDHQAAAKSFENALRLDPYNTDTLLEISNLARAVGQFNLATRIGEFVVSRDPVNAKAYRYLGICHRLEGNADLAIKAFTTALALSPGMTSGHVLLGFVLNEIGESETALAEVEKEPSELWRLVGRAIVYFTLGMKDRSDIALQKLITKHERSTSYNIAYVEAFRGNTDQAFLWLQKAKKYRDPGIGHFVSEKFFAPLHQDERWSILLEQTGQSPEKLAAIRIDIKLPE